MTLTIDLAPEEEARLRERAAAARQDVATFARQAVLERLDRPSLSELLAPLHGAVREAGLGEAEADALIERGRREVYEEHEGRRRGDQP